MGVVVPILLRALPVVQVDQHVGQALMQSILHVICGCLCTLTILWLLIVVVSSVVVCILIVLVLILVVLPSRAAMVILVLLVATIVVGGLCTLPTSIVVLI